MSDKKVLEIDQYEQSLIITSLNTLRSNLMKENKETNFVDETMIKTAHAPNKRKGIFKKDKRKYLNEAR